MLGFGHPGAPEAPDGTSIAKYALMPAQPGMPNGNGTPHAGKHHLDQ